MLHWHSLSVPCEISFQHKGSSLGTESKQQGKWNKYEIQREMEDSGKLWDAFDLSSDRLKGSTCWQLKFESVPGFRDSSNALPCSGCSRNWCHLNLFSSLTILRKMYAFKTFSVELKLQFSFANKPGRTVCLDLCICSVKNVNTARERIAWIFPLDSVSRLLTHDQLATEIVSICLALSLPWALPTLICTMVTQICCNIGQTALTVQLLVSNCVLFAYLKSEENTNVCLTLTVEVEEITVAAVNMCLYLSLPPNKSHTYIVWCTHQKRKHTTLRTSLSVTRVVSKQMRWTH